MSLDRRLVLTNGVGDLDLDLDLGDLDMSLGGGFGGLGGGVSTRFGAEGRLSRGSSMGSSEGMQIMCLNLGGDGAGVGGGRRGGGGGGEEVAEDVLPSCSAIATMSCRQMQSHFSFSQFSSPKLPQHPHSSGPFFGGILCDFLGGAAWSVVRR